MKAVTFSEGVLRDGIAVSRMSSRQGAKLGVQLGSLGRQAGEAFFASLCRVHTPEVTNSGVIEEAWGKQVRLPHTSFTVLARPCQDNPKKRMVFVNTFRFKSKGHRAGGQPGVIRVTLPNLEIGRGVFIYDCADGSGVVRAEQALLVIDEGSTIEIRDTRGEYHAVTMQGGEIVCRKTDGFVSTILEEEMISSSKKKETAG